MKTKPGSSLLWSKISAIWDFISLSIRNLIVLLIVLNVAALTALEIRDKLKSSGTNLIPNNPWNERKKVYPDLTSEDVYELFDETWNRSTYVYEPLAQFREGPRSGKFVNIDPAGFRKGAGAAAWPPDPARYNVFVFGPSSTFGSGLPDWQTVPAFIEKNLLKTKTSATVYNFGRVNYFSTHSVLAFQKLLMDGIVPDVAIFMDGSSEFVFKALTWTERLTTLVNGDAEATKHQWIAAVKSLPLVELAEFLVRYFSKSAHPTGGSQQKKEPDMAKVDVAGPIARYIQNQKLARALAALYKVKVKFVFQPTPTYKYDLTQHLFLKNGLKGHAKAKAGYEALAAMNNRGKLGDDFIWCADIQEPYKKPLYVDAVHFNAELAELLAKCVVDQMGPEPIRKPH
jgi:hypothetical protein